MLLRAGSTISVFPNNLIYKFREEAKMRITKLVLICVCCVMVAPGVWGQTANSPAKPGILGFLDPHTGAFRPVPTAAEEGPDAQL